MSSKRGRLFWLCAGVLASFASHADVGLTVKGFGTLGLARSNVDTAEYVRDLSQPRGLTRDWSGKVDSVLGLQFNLQMGQQTEGVLQLVSRYRYDGSYRPEVTWAFLRHDFSPDLQVRLGRLGTEFYMFSDSRLVGYSNLTVRPPPDFFTPLIFSYFDGADVSAATTVGSGLLRAKLFAGHSPETSPFLGPVTWNLKGSRMVGGHLDYYTGPWQFRVGHAAVKFSSHELPLDVFFPGIVTLVPELSTVGKTSGFDSLGAVYDDGPLRIQAMLGRIRHESESYEDSRAAFVLGSYRLGQFTPYLGYSITKSSASNITTPPPFGPIAQAVTAGTHMDQHTVTLGVRWDFQQNWALKAQLDSIHGSPASVFPFRGPIVSWDGRMRVLSVALDFAY